MCDDPGACSFNPQATTDDGSCSYDCYGCTDELACNFNPLASTDDGSCYYSPSGNCNTECYQEYNSENETVLYFNDFESYAVGDGIVDFAGPPWSFWTAGATDQEAFISNDFAQSGTKSLKFESQSPAGGPQDIVLSAGLANGSYELTFSILVTEGATGYYNVQEYIIPGTDWAFETILYGDGTITYSVDGAVLLAGSYEVGSWLTIAHYIDTESDLMNVYLNEDFLGQVPYDGLELGGVNFYSAGDQINLPRYYLDDLFSRHRTTSRTKF